MQVLPSLDHAAADDDQADELFTTGTAVVVCSVGSLTYKGKRKQFTPDKNTPGGATRKLSDICCALQCVWLTKLLGPAGKLALELYTALTDIQTGKAADPFGWVVTVPV